MLIIFSKVYLLAIGFGYLGNKIIAGGLGLWLGWLPPLCFVVEAAVARGVHVIVLLAGAVRPVTTVAADIDGVGLSGVSAVPVGVERLGTGIHCTTVFAEIF